MRCGACMGAVHAPAWGVCGVRRRIGEAEFQPGDGGMRVLLLWVVGGTNCKCVETAIL